MPNVEEPQMPVAQAPPMQQAPEQVYRPTNTQRMSGHEHFPVQPKHDAKEPGTRGMGSPS